MPSGLLVSYKRRRLLVDDGEEAQRTVILNLQHGPWQNAPHDILVDILDLVTLEDNVERIDVHSPFSCTTPHGLDVIKEDDTMRKFRVGYRSVSRAFYRAATKCRYQMLFINSDLLSSWDHLAKSLATKQDEEGPGRYVRRLEMEIFDVHHTSRVDFIRRIISSCVNLTNLSINIYNTDVLSSDDARDILRTIKDTCAESLKVFRCRLGINFHDSVFLDTIRSFPKLRVGASICAYGPPTPHYFLRRDISAPCLEHLTVTSSGDDTFERMATWDIDALRYLSVHQAASSVELNRLLSVRGYQITCLELLSLRLHDVTDNPIFPHLPNLEELVLGFPGLPRHPGFWMQFNNSPIRRIGIRKFSPQFNRIHQVMYGLSMVMQHATRPAKFPDLERIKLLDFYPAQFKMAKWKYEYINYWVEWRHDCDVQGIAFLDQEGAQIDPNVDNMTLADPMDPAAEEWTLSEEERHRRRRYLRLQQHIRYF